MISIDNHPSLKRFNYNRPYDFIEFKKMSTTDFIKRFSYKDSLITWFDYDGKLYKDIKCDFQPTGILNDIRNVIYKAKQLDFFFITVNANMPFEWKRQNSVVDLFSKYLPDDFKVPEFIRDPANRIKLTQEVILNFISDLQKGLPLKFYKLFSFSYDDGTPMYTCGGILDESNDNQILLRSVNKYTSIDKKIVDINVPILTYKEKIYLDSQINEITKEVNSTKSESDVKKITNRLETEIEPFSLLKGYLEFYKYYPLYFEGHI